MADCGCGQHKIQNLISVLREMASGLGEALQTNKMSPDLRTAKWTDTSQSNLTSASLLIRVENVPLFAPADVGARGIDAEVGTVVFQEAAHVDR
jgi:hypothetical protein